MRSINNLTPNRWKNSVRNRLLLFFISREEGHLKGRNLKRNDFAVFKLLVVLSITKFYTHDIKFSDIYNFLVTGILICKMHFFVK